MIQGELKRVIPREKLRPLIEGIPRLSVRALAAFQYGLAARIGELVWYEHRLKGGEVYYTHGLLKENIDLTMPGIISARIPNFKTQRASKRIEEKVGVIIEKREPWLYSICMRWINLNPSNQLFKWHEAMTRRHIRNHVLRKLFPHPIRRLERNLLRHSRLSHLADDGVTGPVLQHLAGHTNFNTRQIYIKLSPHGIIEELLRKPPGGGIK